MSINSTKALWLGKITFSWNEFSQTDWQQLLARAPDCALQQAWGYGLAIRKQGHEVHHAGLRIDGVTAGIAQIAVRRLLGPLRIALLMRGPVWLHRPDESGERSFLEWIRERLGGAVLLWTPETGMTAGSRHKLASFRRVLTGYSTIQLNLQKPISELRAGLHGKWRNLLCKSEQAGLQIKDVQGGRLLEWIIERNESHRKFVGYAGPSPDFIRSLGRLNNRKIWVAIHESEPVAGIVLHQHGRSATYYAGCTTPKGRELRAHHGLLWHGIVRLRESGTVLFDLGGIDTDKAPGVARFKLGMGGEAVTLAGTYLVPPYFTSSKMQKGPPSLAALPASEDKAA